MTACGPGVERIAEEVAERFPDAKLALMSSDLIPGLVEMREMIQKIDSLHHYYRRHGVDWHRYYRHHEPLAPVRPLSCGEFRFWNGESCVDVRFR